MIIAEGAQDDLLNPIKADYVKDVLTERLGLDSRVTTLGHTQRGGRPCAFDRLMVRSVCHYKRSYSNICAAHATRYRSGGCTSGSVTRDPVLHDRSEREQNHSCTADGGCSNGELF